MIKLPITDNETIINNSMEKIKQLLYGEQGKDILTVLIVILVGLASFGLGRLSKEETLSSNKTGVTQYINTDIVSAAGQTNSYNSSSGPLTNNSSTKTIQGKNLGNYFASKRGKKYYPIECSAGNTIKDANKVWFKTEIEAQQAGYELSSAC